MFYTVITHFEHAYESYFWETGFYGNKILRSLWFMSIQKRYKIVHLSGFTTMTLRQSLVRYLRKFVLLFIISFQKAYM